MAISINEDLQRILIEAGIPVEQRAKALKIAAKVEAEKKENSASGPKSKNKFTILLRCDDPALKSVLESQEAFLVKTPDSLDENTILNRITISAARQNDSIKRGKGKISTWADWIQLIKGKYRNTEDTNVQNVGKSPVRILVLSTAEIPFSK